jgi:hypothetical protein
MGEEVVVACFEVYPGIAWNCEKKKKKRNAAIIDLGYDPRTLKVT